MKNILIPLMFLIVFIIISCDEEESNSCGNYIVDKGEICDGGEWDCEYLIPGTRGSAACRYDCSGYDTGWCKEPYCGDGIKDSDEDCDSDSVACSSLVSGTKGDAPCKYDCSGYDTSVCRVPVCGDYEIDSGEVCDGDSKLCEVLDGSYYGNALCKSDCSGYNMSFCLEFQEFTFSITDQCDDGADIRFRLFQFASSESSGYDRFWPSDSTKVYVSNGLNNKASTKIACEKSTLICYGGEPDDSSGSYWGVGLNANHGCDNCCFKCEDGVEKNVDLICGSGDISSCTKTADCGANDICRENKCVSPLGLSWYIYAESMTFNNTKPDGTDWDNGLGDYIKPDIMAIVLKNDTIILQTEEISDSYSASWSGERILTSINVGDEIQFCAVDIDVSDHDVAGCVVGSGNDIAEILKKGSFTQTDFKIPGVSSFKFTFKLYN